MTARSTFLATVVTVVVAMAANSPVRAQLSDSSPFSPASTAAAGAQSSDPNALELRGIMESPEGIRYNIYDPAKKSSAWVGVEEKDAPFFIKSADPRAETATLRVNGQWVNLTLKQAHVAAANAPGSPGALTNGVVLQPSPADDQKRLQAVADEVRRRRALREQAAQPPGQPGIAPMGPGGPRRP